MCLHIDSSRRQQPFLPKSITTLRTTFSSESRWIDSCPSFSSMDTAPGIQNVQIGVNGTEMAKIHSAEEIGHSVEGLRGPNNQSVIVVVNETEIMETFYICYVNWTLKHVESPAREHIPPPIVASPPRRKKYKSETSSSKTATSASTSQTPHVERSHMSRHTSTSVLQKKDKPHAGFSGEEMVSFPINVISVHWFLAVLDLQMWIVTIYDSAQSMNLFGKYNIGGEFESFGNSIISELDLIECWNYFPDRHRDTAIMKFLQAIDVSQQQHIKGGEDCGVFVFIYGNDCFGGTGED
ncbi:unnamed protein product [Lactuca virosa]|uniref:Ubiquitin-like protease family profile domain-containing protein n=1 Tax=Lactuca virosa TaxID=75947 RepID=A0AAU9MII8_9ASTR|nr:unnamed protein product [Lactuca virosa]